MPDGLPPIIQAVNKLIAALLRSEREVAVRLVNAYGRAYRTLQADIDALIRAMDELNEPTWGQVERLTLYRSLQTQISAEIGRYAVIAENEIDESVQATIAAALRDSGRLMQLSLPGLDQAVVKGILYGLNPEAVFTMMGFLEKTSPLYVNLQRLGADVAALVAEKLKQGIILGYNPRKVARIITQATGQGLTWSLNTARTANLWAYRLTAHANYRANAHVVRGWVWWSQLGDPRTCMSCVNQHGSEHALEEVLNDHHAGRCTPLPVTKSYRELGVDVSEPALKFQRGEEWFRSLSAAEQRQLMGPARWDAWKAGEFEFSDLSVPYQDDVYGEMLREASLKGVLGERAKSYYQ